MYKRSPLSPSLPLAALYCLALLSLLPTNALGQDVHYSSFYSSSGGQEDVQLGNFSLVLEDVNDDEVLDLVLASHTSSTAEPEAGKPSAIRVVSGATGATLFELAGETPGDGLGSGQIESVLDVNGDGIAELLVVSPFADNPANAAIDVGRVTLIDTAAGAILLDVYGDNAGDSLGSGGVQVVDATGDASTTLVVIASPLADSSNGTTVDVGSVSLYSSPQFQRVSSTYGAFTGDMIGDVCTVSPGDIDEDGTVDFIIGASQADSAEGMDDNVGSLEAISGTNGSRIYYQLYDDDTGEAGSSICRLFDDVNGDGVTDLLHGSGAHSGINVARSRVGRTHIVSGKTGESLHFTEGKFSGDRLGNKSGNSFKHFIIEDHNGDGIKDYLISAKAGDSEQSANDNVGYSRLISGMDSSTVFEVQGKFSLDELQVSGKVGDFNGDGIDDFTLVAIPGDSAEGANDNVGYTQAVNGVNGEVLWETVGQFAQDRFAATPVPLTDFDGDGILDVAVTRAFADSAEGADDDVGRVRVLSGVDGRVLSDTLGRSANSMLSIPRPFILTDIDGDGGADLLLREPGRSISDPPLSNAGGLTAISGATGASLYELNGGQENQRLGDGVIRLTEDLDGDSLQELLIADPDGGSAGRVRVMSAATGEILTTLEGKNEGDRFSGSQIRTPGDLNGDGLNDMWVISSAALNSESNLSNAGALEAFIRDLCPDDSEKTLAGDCGCGVADEDLNANGISDCLPNQDANASFQDIIERLDALNKPKKRQIRALLKEAIALLKDKSDSLTFSSGTAKRFQKRLKRLRKGLRRAKSKRSRKRATRRISRLLTNLSSALE